MSNFRVSTLIFPLHAVAQQYRSGIQGQQQDQQYNDGAGRDGVEFRLRARCPLIDLDRQCCEFRERPVRVNADECGCAHYNERRSFTDGARDSQNASR